MSDIAIQVEDLSKAYQLGKIGTGTISRDLERFFVTKILGKEDPFLKIGQTNDRSVKGTSDIVWSLKDVNFTINQGDAVGIIGKNGAGKSTLLKVIYGLYDCDEGNISWKSEPVLGPKFHLVPGMPFMKYLAQDFDLMPFITVGENVGKFLSNFYPKEKQDRIDELLNLVEMAEFKHVKAKFLSGGQMQRVALARVLAQEPEVLLLDEPFSHIDNFRKNKLRRKIFQYLKEKQITTIIATHDSTDVLSFADEVLVMKNGIPQRIIIKDFVDDIVLTEEAKSKLPDDLKDGLIQSSNKENTPLFILIGVFDAFFRYLSDILHSHMDYDEHLFWKTVIGSIEEYKQDNPHLTDRFEKYNLFEPEFKRFYINSLKLLNNGYAEQTGFAVPKKGSKLPNPLYVIRQYEMNEFTEIGETIQHQS